MNRLTVLYRGGERRELRSPHELLLEFRPLYDELLVHGLETATGTERVEWSLIDCLRSDGAVRLIA